MYKCTNFDLQQLNWIFLLFSMKFVHENRQLLQHMTLKEWACILLFCHSHNNISNVCLLHCKFLPHENRGDWEFKRVPAGKTCTIHGKGL